MALTALEGGPLGGGGVEAGVAALVTPSFGLTHFFRTGSYLKELASPRLALMARGCEDEEDVEERSLLLPPPSQPPNQEDLAVVAPGRVSFWAVRDSC